MNQDNFFHQPTLPGVPSPPAIIPAEQIPKFIGPYKIECLLDKGGMSILYLGTHNAGKEPTTIKVLSPKFLSNHEIVKRFLKEAEIIALADHPNIVKLYGYGEWEGGLYIAMEFIQGISLRQYILQNPTSLKHALEMVIDIAYALCHFHTHGVIHRDLKPENILVTQSGVIKVIDFGIAQLLTEKGSEGTPSRQRLIGTPIYMSPEQRENPESVSFPSDIYSLGIILYELVLGRLSHGQIQLSLMPKGIQKILTKALQPDPKNRYQDVVDFILDVSNYLQSENLVKEKKPTDRLSELSENFQKSQLILIPEVPPEQLSMEIGIALEKNLSISGVYHDFFELPDGAFAAIMAESTAKDAEGFVYMSIFKGMMQALSRLKSKPAELATVLNSLMIKDSQEHIFILTYIIFYPNQNLLQYISCGLGNIWQYSPETQTVTKISVENIALGIDSEAEFHDVTIPWNVGDRIIIGNFAGMLSNPALENEFNEDIFQAAIKETKDLSPQKQSEYLLRKVRVMFKKIERTICLICFKRKI